MLKLLEIQGFKSFPDKTVLDFSAGMTAVVGPNGSGKSNVVDAIRWVLGEQSVKNIRISSGADVIFTGTARRPASGTASVTLRFDNASGAFPIEFQEVAVSRKVYRDANSSYAINGKPVRLKDVTQLLAGAKLGVKGMGIINQGSSDVFLRANPVERREMLEEMVGLKEYRLKKEEAERKIAETNDNLAHARQSLVDNEPTLRSLKRQVSRWESREAKAQELKVLEEQYFAYKVHEIQESFRDPRELERDRDRTNAAIAAIMQSIENHDREIRSLETGDPQTVEQESRLENELRAVSDRRSETERLMGKIEGQLEALAAEATTGSLDVGALSAGIKTVERLLREAMAADDLTHLRRGVEEALDEIRTLLQGKKSTAQHQHGNFKKELAEQSAVLRTLAEQSRTIQQELRQLRQTATEQTKEVRSTYQSLESDRVELQKLQAERSAFAFDEEKRAMREDDLRMRMREAGWEYDAVLKTAAALIRAGGNLPPGQIPETETRILRLRREVSLIGEIDPEVVKEYGILKERSEFLEQQREDLEGALDDWEALNRSLEEKITQGFQNALTHIDREFNRYFGVIFGGGKASLRLERIERPGSSSENGDTNPSAESAHPADFGIDFSVHLPRKKLHTLEALSGGEKALTAIALLLAIIAYGQPPFVVLDEIDAALDETNSGRIAQLLAELADRVQLILITHNRSVMTASRALYGITMDDGVSKVFSLRFADAEALATRDVHDPLPTAGV